MTYAFLLSLFLVTGEAQNYSGHGTFDSYEECMQEIGEIVEQISEETGAIRGAWYDCKLQQKEYDM